MTQFVLNVPGAKTQAEADRMLGMVMEGSRCTWPDEPSRLLIDYVVVECIRAGLLELAEPA